MAFFKKKITEQEAATQSVLSALSETKNAWPTIYKALRESHGDKFVVEDETMAAFDLSLAAITQELQVVRNLFAKDQADRLYRWVLHSVDSPEYGEYAKEEIKEYDEVFQRGLKNIELGESPLDAIPARLLHRWLGKKLKDFEVEIRGRKTGVISPLLVMHVTSILTASLGTWKGVKKNFKLVEGDLPMNYENLGLRDCQPKLDENKPDGTVQYHDEKGNVKEKWVPPQQLRELLKKGRARRVYQVLIKGPWEGVKEDHWELSDEQVRKFVDAEGIAYAICPYKKGEPQYSLVAKRLWERMEDVEKIMGNPGLSPEEQQQEIRKLIEK